MKLEPIRDEFVFRDECFPSQKVIIWHTVLVDKVPLTESCPECSGTTGYRCRVVIERVAREATGNKNVKWKGNWPDYSDGWMGGVAVMALKFLYNQERAFCSSASCLKHVHWKIPQLIN